MPDAPDVQVEVEMDASASGDEVEGVKRAFAVAGIPVRVEAGIETRSAGDVPWVVYISAPVAAFIAAFAAQTGKNAADGIRRLVTDIYEARKS